MTGRSINIEKLLWASIEDYCGLWELVWEMNTLYPDNSSEKSQHMAFQGTLYLLSRDLVALFYCEEPYGSMTAIVIGDNYVDFLRDLKIWEAPSPGSCSVRVSATAAGEKYYNDMLASRKYQ